MAEISVQTQPSRPMSEMVIDRIWRFFCSVRAAICEIAFLALLVLLGTLRGSEAPQWMANGLPFMQPVVNRWYKWDVYRSIPFVLILTVLSIAIAVCTVNRVPAIWQSISHPNITTSRGWLRGADASATFSAINGTPTTLVEEMKGVLAKRRYRVLTQQVGNDIHLYADKNRYAKMGTFPFHLALILILVGGIVVQHYGFQDKQFMVTEGDTQNVGHGTNLSIRLNKFSDTYSEMGVASQYKSNITILDNGKDVKTEDITVNHPVSYNNATIYQASLGYAKTFKITDGNGNILYDDSTQIGLFNLKGNPDAPAGLIDLPAINSQLVFVGPDSAPFNQPQLDTLHLTSDQLWVQLSTKDASGNYVNQPGQKITLKQPMKIGQYTIQWLGTQNVSVMQVAYNPAVPIFIIAAIMAIGGLIVTFYFPHRRIRAIAASTPAGASIQIAPLAKRDWSGKHDFLRVIEAARDKLGEPQELKLPKSGTEWESYTRSTPASS